MHFQQIRHLALLSFVCLLTACGMPSDYHRRSLPPLEEYQEPVISPIPEGQPQIIQENRETINPAVQSLLNDAEAHKASGNYHIALIKLERAARIQPTQAEIWYQMAEVRFQEKNYNQAEQLAHKALSLGQGDAAIESRASNLLLRIQTSRDRMFISQDSV